jgi:hypothetical protein
MKRSIRKTANLSESISHQLNMYALSASAAGVSLLALAQLAEARIVYHPAHHTFRPNSQYPLVFDGVAAFKINLISFTSTIAGAHRKELQIQGKEGGNVDATSLRGSYFVVGLNKGEMIPNSKIFLSQGSMGQVDSYNGHRTCYQPFWENAENLYVGLEFPIKGRIHLWMGEDERPL